MTLSFEWDKAKNKVNKSKHQISFEEAAEIFVQPNTKITASHITGTDITRYKAVGNLKGKFYTVIFIYRNKKIRIISARRARKNEKREYSKL